MGMQIWNVSLAALMRERNGWTDVLVWVRIELIFFTVAYVVLGFGFVTQTVWITRVCFSYR